MAWFAWMLFRQFRNRGSTGGFEAYMEIALGTALVAAAIHSGVSGMMVMPMTQLLSAVFAGWGLSLIIQAQNGQNKGSGKVVGFIILTLALLIQGLWPDIIQLRERQNYYLKKINRDLIGLHPRFWVQGKIGYDY
jgi:hypothetical protein